MRPADEQFVGREEELAALEQAWSAVVRGHPQLVLVSGDAGIGKSALVARFLDTRADGGTDGRAGARVLRGGCFGLVSAELPYGPVVQALRPLGEAGEPGIPADAATLCAALGGSVAGVGEATRWAQSRLFETTLRLLGELSREQPLVLVLEDLHWADRATLDLLLFLLGNVVTDRILFLLTARCDEPDAAPWLTEGLQRLTSSRSAEVLELAPLAPDRAADLAAALGVGEDDAGGLIERAGGNPLFLTELARSRTAGALPRRLRDLLLLRFRHVSAEARRVVELLATAAAPLPGRLVVLALEDDVADPRAAVAEAFEAHLLAPGGDLVRLGQALLGEAVYGALPPTERMWLHERIAEAVERDPALGDAAWALAAFHWEKAGREDRLAVPLARAAEAAGRCFAFAEAARAWQRLLRLDDQGAGAIAAAGMDRPQVLLEAASALRWSADPEDGVELLREAVRLLGGDPARSALAAEQLARLCVDLGRMEDALTAAERAEELASGAPDRVRARIVSTHAAVLMVRGEYEASRQRCLLALRLTPSREASWELSHTFTVLGVDLINQGDVDGATAALADAAAASRGLHDPEAAVRRYVNHAYVLETAGRYEAAVAVCEEGLAHAEQHDLYAVAGAPLLANQASALIAMGELHRARSVLRRAIDRPGRSSSVLYARLRLAEIEAELGDLDAAEALLGQGAGVLDVESVVQTQFRLVRGLLALAGRRPEEALDAARAEADRRDGGTEPLVGLRLMAVGLQALGMSTAARSPRRLPPEVAGVAAELLKTAGALRDQAPLPPCEDLYELCVAEYQDSLGQAAAPQWQGLAERLEEGARTRLLPYVRYREAMVLLAREGRRAAEAALRQAWDLLEPLGDVPLRREVAALAATCRIALPAANATAGTAAGTAAPVQPFGLTPREGEVLALLCDGATNRQIARSLGMSERTAGVHVSHILAKLSARNRAEAIAIAHRTGAVRVPSP